MESCRTSEPRVLFIGYGPTDCEQFRRVLARHGYSLRVAENPTEGIAQLKNGLLPQFIFLDIRSHGLPGLETLPVLKEMVSSRPVIVIVTPRQARAAILAVQRGADSFLPYPFEDADLAMVLTDLSQALSRPGSVLKEEVPGVEFISVSDKMLQIKDIIRQVACTDVPVLLQGESGVGKEVVTRYLHAQSERRGGPFIRVNCAALSADLIESELFGHEKGSFTGATTQNAGKFELADGGTLFLDEITELSLPIQAKLLHVLQDGCFFKVGGSKYVTTDARIVAATNKVLKEAVQAGHFREDLYFRLDVIDIRIPPLRERKEDIPLLCAYFVEKYATRYHRAYDQLPDWIMDLFQSYDWPGNVRELENVVRRLMVLPDARMVLQEIQAAVARASPALPSAPSAIPLLDVSLKSMREQNRLSNSRAERDIILRTLDSNQWNRKKTAAQLGISYKTLLNKLEKWDLRPPDLNGHG